MKSPYMPNQKQLRAAIGEEFTQDIDELMSLYGHNSRSQTIEFILRNHIKEELRIARQMTELRKKQK